MIYVNSFVAYIDYLGFANYVNSNVRSPEKPLLLLDAFSSVTQMLNIEKQLKITAFSDNIVISSKAPNITTDLKFNYEWLKFIVYINAVQMYVTTLSILPIRGGISYGGLYCKKKILFGESMNDAYALESAQAFYPRIVINPRFINSDLEPENRCHDVLHSTLLNLGDNPEEYKRKFPICRDFDNVLFCNYLSQTCDYSNNSWNHNAKDKLEQHKQFIVRCISRTQNNINVNRKYSWMRNYHNWFCMPFKEFQDLLIPDDSSYTHQTL